MHTSKFAHTHTTAYLRGEKLARSEEEGQRSTVEGTKTSQKSFYILTENISQKLLFKWISGRRRMDGRGTERSSNLRLQTESILTTQTLGIK